MVWIISVILFLLAILLLFLRGIKGPAYTLETIERPILGLLRQGYNGGFVIVSIGYTKKFVQLRKYINSPGDYGIEFGFPKAKHFEYYFKKLEELCATDGIDYTISNPDNNGSLAFLYVGFGKEHLIATEFVRKVLLNVFEVGQDVKLFAKLENATIEDKLIDR